MTASTIARFESLLNEILTIPSISFRIEAIEWLKGEYLEGGNVPFIEAKFDEYSLEDFFCEISILDNYFEQYIFDEEETAKEILIDRLLNDPFFEVILLRNHA